MFLITEFLYSDIKLGIASGIGSWQTQLQVSHKSLNESIQIRKQLRVSEAQGIVRFVSSEEKVWLNKELLGSNNIKSSTRGKAQSDYKVAKQS